MSDDQSHRLNDARSVDQLPRAIKTRTTSKTVPSHGGQSAYLRRLSMTETSDLPEPSEQQPKLFSQTVTTVDECDGKVWMTVWDNSESEPGGYDKAVALMSIEMSPDVSDSLGSLLIHASAVARNNPTMTK